MCNNMNEIVKAFYDVMYKYQKYFSQKGVEKNLNAWANNKGELINLLRRHPNWNEQELSIIFNLSESREIERDIVDECVFALNELVAESNLTHEQRENFETSLRVATYEYSKFISDDNIEIIKVRGNIKCNSAQKVSRIIGKLCTQFGINHHKSYNSVFARLADAFNPLVIQKTAVLSVHPCDFLEMSNKDNSWNSCHGLESGTYQAGCLSYLADAVSMIFFTVDDDVKEQFHKHPKRTRQVFCYTDNLLLQSRFYPTDNNEQFTQYRSLIQKAFTDCLGIPNFWVLKTKYNETKECYTITEGSRQYHDYDDYAKVSLIKGAETHGDLSIGHPSLCVCCGESYTYGRLKCDCENLVVCVDCGETVPASNARYMDDIYSCNSCSHICAMCNITVRSDMYPAFNREGHLLEVCHSCYSDMTSTCGTCSISSVCNMISGARFCRRVTIHAVVA